jgi:hypothetical protein
MPRTCSAKALADLLAKISRNLAFTSLDLNQLAIARRGRRLERTMDKAAHAHQVLFALGAAYSVVNAARIKMLHHFDGGKLHQAFAVNGFQGAKSTTAPQFVLAGAGRGNDYSLLAGEPRHVRAAFYHVGEACAEYPI